MKKPPLFVLCVLCALLTCCSDTVGLGTVNCLLTVNNGPGNYIVLVHNSNGPLPDTPANYAAMTEKAIASGTGASPVKLIWSVEVKSGSLLITVSSGSTKKMVIGSFDSMGNAVVDWSTMSAIPSP